MADRENNEKEFRKKQGNLIDFAAVVPKFSMNIAAVSETINMQEMLMISHLQRGAKEWRCQGGKFPHRRLNF